MRAPECGGQRELRVNDAEAMGDIPTKIWGAVGWLDDNAMSENREACGEFEERR